MKDALTTVGNELFLDDLFFAYLYFDLDPALQPVVPNLDTVKFKALGFAINGGVNQANFPYSWRLPAYIGELSRDGWVIASDWVKVSGFPASVKHYRVDLSHRPTRIAAHDFIKRYPSFLPNEDDCCDY